MLVFIWNYFAHLVFPGVKIFALQCIEMRSTFCCIISIIIIIIIIVVPLSLHVNKYLLI